MKVWKIIENKKKSEEQPQNQSPEQQPNEQSQSQSTYQQSKEQPQNQSSEQQSKEQPQNQSPEQQPEEQSENQGSEQQSKEQPQNQSSEQQSKEQPQNQSPEQQSKEQSQGQSPEQQPNEQAQGQSSEHQSEEQSQNQGSEQQLNEQSQDQSSKQQSEEQSQNQSSSQQSEEQLQNHSSSQQSEEQSQNQGSEQQPEEQSQNQGSDQQSKEQSQNQNATNKTQEDNKSNKKSNDNEKDISKKSNQTKETSKKEILQNLKATLTKIAKSKIKEEQEEKEEEDSISSDFLDILADLPSFDNSQKSDGYSIDTSYSGTIPDSVIKIIINKFLNRRFLKMDSTLNSRSKSLEKTKGFYKLDCKKLIKDLETGQLTKIPFDKYDYKEEAGKSENIPFSFYFDLSGSMNNYTGLLSVLAIELLKKDIKVLIGFNEKVNVQIDKIKGIDNIEEFKKLLSTFGEEYYGYSKPKDKLIKENNVHYRIIGQNLDNYLIQKKAEKCVVFSDFHPIKEVCNLSLYTEVYWFCFEKSFERKDLNEKYNGFLYKVQNLNDIVKGLLIINERKFRNLCYIDDPNILKKKIR